jgi:hypothetical protein
LSLNTQSNTDNFPNDNRIGLKKCINTEQQRINYEYVGNVNVEADTGVNTGVNAQSEKTKENFFTNIRLDPIDDINDLVPNINFCSNPVYKTIVTLILVGIIIYFIWFVTRKKYWDDESLFETSSTPFNTPINY